jgi:hypothetical protein
VRAARLDVRLLLQALERGEFYASTGVLLEDVRSDAKRITVTVKPDAWAKYRIEFVGKDGRVLRDVPATTATYEISGDEGYVRARVIESNGRMAWVQPIVVSPARPAPGFVALLWVAIGGGMWLTILGRRR